MGSVDADLVHADFAKLSELTTRSLDVVLDTEPVPDVALLRVAVETLRGLGFP